MEVLVAIIKRVVKSVNNVADLLDPQAFPRFFQLFTNRESAKEMSSTVLSGLIHKHPMASLTNTTLAYQVCLSKDVRVIVEVQL